VPNQRRSAATPPSAKTLISFQRVRALAGGVATGRSTTSTAPSGGDSCGSDGRDMGGVMVPMKR